MARSSSERRWTPVDMIWAAILVLLGIWVTSEAWVDLVRTAQRDPESRYVFLVPLVAAWLVWVRRRRLRQCVLRGRVIGWSLVIAGWFLFSTGERLSVETVWYSGALILVVGCLLSAVGTDALRRFLPVLLVLGLLIPVPWVMRPQLGPPVASATAQATQGALELLGRPVQRRGSLLTVQDTEISISQDSCGLGFLFMLLTLLVAAVFGAPLRNSVRVLVLAAAPVVVFFFVVARGVLAVWLFSSQPRSVAEHFHDVSAMFMLPAAFLVLMGLIATLRWAFVPVNLYTLARGD